MWSIIIASLCILILVNSIFPLSFSPNGNWTLSRDPEKECVHEFLCSPLNYTWYGDVNDLSMSTNISSAVLPSIPSISLSSNTSSIKSNQTWIVYNSTTACEALLRQGIRKIYFHGDSYMRQIYTGMLILLSGNYRNGSLREDPGSIGCEYHKQLYEKRCGVQQLNHLGFVCNGKVHLDPLLNTLYGTGHCSTKDKNIILFSFGNHKTRSGNGGRWGVNNATIYQELFERETCPGLRSNKNENCRVFWMSTHHRLIGWFDDEQPAIVQAFNEEMRQFFDSGKCGNTGYIDVYNMTKQLVLHHPAEAEHMTFDKVHWGMQVNLLKGQMILNAILTP